MKTVTRAQIAAYFLRLGCIGFGGPPAHIALMRRELVEQRGWIDAAQFNADLATANLIPGPTSTELAIYIGYRLRGAPGAFIAGIGFILPAFVFVLLLAIAYSSTSTFGWLDGVLYAVKPVALALMTNGVIQLGKGLTRDWRETAIFFVAMAALLVLNINVLLLFVLAGAALLLLHGFRPQPTSALLSLGMATSATAVSTLAILWTFLKIGLVIYGGGFALAGIMQQELVQTLGWLSARELLDGIAIGQSTPGPVFTTATFIGYRVGGLPGAIAATIGIFAPAFALVLLENRLFGRFKDRAAFKLFLSGVNAAVVASLVVAIAQLGASALPDVFALGLCIAAFVALAWKKIDAHWLVGIAIVLGLARLAFSLLAIRP